MKRLHNGEPKKEKFEHTRPKISLDNYIKNPYIIDIIREYYDEDVLKYKQIYSRCIKYFEFKRVVVKCPRNNLCLNCYFYGDECINNHIKKDRVPLFMSTMNFCECEDIFLDNGDTPEFIYNSLRELYFQ